MKTTISKELLTRYVAGGCTPAEEQVIEEWYASFEEESPYFEDESSEAAIDLKAQTKETIRTIIGKSAIRRRMINYGSVAAAFLILIMSGICGVFLSRENAQRNVVEKHPIQTDSTSITPGANKAILTLADGSIIDLDKAANGALATDGESKISKQADGRLEYQHANSPLTTDHSPAYNILSTPRGGQYMIVLPDGSSVWLNAASSIRFPTAFTGDERKVEITGEAYFEVKTLRLRSGQKMPFIVQKGDMRVEVLGTHFNINAYDDEAASRVTLLEGSVKVGREESVILKPGEQTSVSQSSQPSQPIPVQTEEVMAWKNGLFQFNNVTIETIMKQVARWYDVKVVYERAGSQDLFRGKIYRNEDISQLLRILELSGARFKIEGKTIIVQ